MNRYIEKLNELAIKAASKGEIPIACLIVKDNNIIAQGINCREQENKIDGHAEINAINLAAKQLNTWKLNDCDMYISAEPCLMCYGAIMQARINKVYVASCQDSNKKLCFSNYIEDDQLIDYSLVNDESSQIIRDFFIKKRG